MISPSQHGIIAFLIKRINGVYHFLVQAKSEPGCFDLLELAPTVQCLTGSYEQNALEYVVPYLAEVQSSNSERVIYDVYQSEEGGRFFQEQNRNMLVIADDSLQLDASGRYMWVSLWQVMHLLQFSNIFNIGARSLISAVMIHE
jgi:oxidase EvaA